MEGDRFMATTGAAAELLQVKALEKEATRIKGIQERNQVRLQHFLNARQRTIGLDVEALNNQIQEKRRLKDLEKEAERLEAARNAEIARILEGREHEERLARRKAMDCFKVEWDQQKHAMVESRRKVLNFGEPAEKCGLASLQQLCGEDKSATERRKLQAEQMRLWVMQQMEERKYRSLVESAEDKKYAEFLKQVSSLSNQHEKEEVAMHKALTKQIQLENQAQAQARMAARAEASQTKLREDEQLLARAQADPLLAEANDYVMEGSGRIRRDQFRGYTSSQRNLIFKENTELIKERAETKDAEKWQEKVWAAQQESWRQQLEAQECEQRQQRQALALEQQQELLEQKGQHLQSAAKAKIDAFGRVSDDFYKAFGTSCR